MGLRQLQVSLPPQLQMSLLWPPKPQEQAASQVPAHLLSFSWSIHWLHVRIDICQSTCSCPFLSNSCTSRTSSAWLLVRQSLLSSPTTMSCLSSRCCSASLGLLKQPPLLPSSHCRGTSCQRGTGRKACRSCARPGAASRWSHSLSMGTSSWTDTRCGIHHYCCWLQSQRRIVVWVACRLIDDVTNCLGYRFYSRN